MRSRSAPLVALLLLAGCGGSDPAASGPPRWEACRSSAEARARVQAEVDQGNAFGVQGTPTLVVNGTSYLGLPTQPSTPGLEAIVTSAIAVAQASGVPRDQYYDQLVVAASSGDMPVPVGSAPVRGPPDAWVTIVEFSDFQCPYCRSAEPELEAVLAAHPQDVRLVYEQYPLAFHDRALPAALAADCAGQQDRFWEMHDLLMAGALDDASLAGYARQLGLE